MTVDEALVTLLSESTEVIARCSARVFHLEVFQNIPADARYPCVVYRKTDSIPEKELDGNNAYQTEQYDIYVIAKKSADLRPIADQILNFGKPDFNEAVWADVRFCNVEQVDSDSDSEENDFAIEQQELGYKVSTVTVAITHTSC
jgi:hypothetical protein